MVHVAPFTLCVWQYRENQYDSIVEIDETFIVGAEKNRHANKRTKGTQGRNVSTNALVLGFKDRETGKVRGFVVPNTKSVSLLPLIKKTIEEGSVVITTSL